MDELKDAISKEVLDTLTMEDLWKSPRLKKFVEKKYPRAYLSITETMREFGLYNFIKLAESQQKVMEEAINLGSIDSFPGKNVDFALKVIKKNNIKANDKLFVSGIPSKFELSKFVEEYASEKTYTEWRKALKGINATKTNIERILNNHKSKFKE